MKLANYGGYSFQIWFVRWYLSAVQCNIKFVEIAPIVFELQWAEKVLMGVRVNNTLCITRFSWPLTHYRVF